VAPTAGDPLAISGRKKTKTVIGIVTECIEKCSWVLREHGPLPIHPVPIPGTGFGFTSVLPEADASCSQVVGCEPPILLPPHQGVSLPRSSLGGPAPCVIPGIS
jgi:hypothetical protein